MKCISREIVIFGFWQWNLTSKEDQILVFLGAFAKQLPSTRVFQHLLIFG
jgi:hypothetical protein